MNKQSNVINSNDKSDQVLNILRMTNRFVIKVTNHIFLAKVNEQDEEYLLINDRYQVIDKIFWINDYGIPKIMKDRKYRIGTTPIISYNGYVARVPVDCARGIDPLKVFNRKGDIILTVNSAVTKIRACGHVSTTFGMVPYFTTKLNNNLRFIGIGGISPIHITNSTDCFLCLESFYVIDEKKNKILYSEICSRKASAKRIDNEFFNKNYICIISGLLWWFENNYKLKFL